MYTEPTLQRLENLSVLPALGHRPGLLRAPWEDVLPLEIKNPIGKPRQE